VLTYYLRRQIAHKAARENRRLTLVEVARETGIGRMTLTRMADHPGYNAETVNLDRLCRYFGCRIEELVEYRPDPAESEPSPKPKRTVTKGKKDAAAEKAAAQPKPRGTTDFRL